ncbi:MAG: peptide ABC transporter substrate-binding protein [Chlamydiae bacterium]|nr:peptide ABC transporter substrate-binding protein [Chlamydiota bacterium]
MDPRIAIEIPSVSKLLFEGLMRINNEGKMEPAIAETYEISDDKKIYTFHLKKTFWSNGNPLTAHDFVHAWKTIINHEVQTRAGYNFYIIKNVKEILQGTLSIEEVGFSALDDFTLMIKLENPNPYFLELLANPCFFPISRKIDKENPKWVYKEGNNFICNGPFSLEKHRIDNEIVLRKNSHYWNEKEVRLPGIKISILKDPTTTLALFEKNEIDWMGRPLSSISLEAIPTLKKKGELHTIPCLGLHWIVVNTESFPFKNKKMRKAFAYAINRKEITDYLLQEGEIPALGIIPKSLSFQDTPYFPDSNPDLTLQLFNEALKELEITKEQLPEIVLSIHASTMQQKLGEVLQAQLTRIFGLRVKLEQQEWKVHLDKMQREDFQLGTIGWVWWYRDPFYTLQAFRNRCDGINLSRWENSAYQDLLNQAEKEIDFDKRNDLLHKAETLLMDEMPVIPIYFFTLSYIKKDYLKNVYVSELYDVDFSRAYFEQSNN